MKTTVHYSRKKDSKGYQVIEVATGELLAQFGSGPAERYRAERFQVKVEHPDVLRLADRVAGKYPELKRRALRAAMLYVDQKVRLNGAEGHYYVGSQSKSDVTYDVDTELGSCTCVDWENGLLGMSKAAPWCGNGPKCKHLLACYLAQILGL